MSRTSFIVLALAVFVLGARPVLAQSSDPTERAGSERRGELEPTEHLDEPAPTAGEPAADVPDANEAADAPDPNEAADIPGETGRTEGAPGVPALPAPPGSSVSIDPPHTGVHEPERAPEAVPDTAEEESEDPVVDFEPGEGLRIVSSDGCFELTTRVRGMLLFTTELLDGADATVDLELRRARVTFQGVVFDPHLRYRFQLAVAPRDLGWVGGLDGHATRTPLLDWYLESRHLRDLNVRAGQFVTNISRERTVSSSSFQLVDRSLMSNEFNLDRDIGIELRSTDFLGLGRLRYYAGVTIGEGRDSLLSADTGFLYYVRVETLPLGLFDDYVQGDLDRSSEPRISIGGAYAFLDRAHNDRGILGSAPLDGGTTDMHLLNADVYFVYRGLSLMYEFTWREGFRRNGHAIDEQTMMEFPLAAPRNGYGMYAQAGYLLPDLPIEIAARWGRVAPLGAFTGLRERQELGGGVSIYFHEHALKLQADFFELWEGSAIEQGEERVRVMLQAAL